MYNGKKFLLTLLWGLACGTLVFSQNQRPVYPAPELTPEAKALRDARRVWRPQHTRADLPLPAGIDNSRTKYFPAVFNQIGNSCSQASSIGYLFTYEMNRLLDRDASQAENTFSYFYTWNFLNDGKDEGSFSESGLALARVNGVMNRKDFPDQMSAYRYSWASGYDKYIRAMHYRVKEILSIPLETRDDIDNARRYLAEGGCFTYSSCSSNWRMNDSYDGPSATGYKSLLTQLATDGAHAMTIVGYDDLVEFTPAGGETTHGAFIVVNSWGRFSHDEGHFYIPYHFFLQSRPNLLLDTSGTGCIVEYHEPKVVFKVKVTHDSRNDLMFSLGVADKAYAKTPTITYPSSTMNYQGGDHPLPGSKSYCQPPYTLEMAFNFTDRIDNYADYTEPKYFLTVMQRASGSAEGQGTIEYFSVIDYRTNPPREYVCTDIDHTVLQRGMNLFSVATVPPRMSSASPVRWIERGKVSDKTHIVRTALGHYAKVDFVEYDAKTGKVKIHYLYQPQGTRLSNY